MKDVRKPPGGYLKEEGSRAEGTPRAKVADVFKGHKKFCVTEAVWAKEKTPRAEVRKETRSQIFYGLVGHEKGFDFYAKMGATAEFPLKMSYFTSGGKKKKGSFLYNFKIPFSVPSYKEV